MVLRTRAKSGAASGAEATVEETGMGAAVAVSGSAKMRKEEAFWLAELGSGVVVAVAAAAPEEAKMLLFLLRDTKKRLLKKRRK